MTATAIPEQSGLPTRRKRLVEATKRSLPRLRELLVHAVGQIRILKKVYPGIMHALIFWGVTTQVIGTAINLQQMDLFIPFLELPFPRGAGYLAYELIMDLAGVAILLGVVMAAFRRRVLRPKALESRWDDYYAILLLALIPLVGFTTEGLRLVSASPPWAAWAPVGNQVANLMRALGMTPAGALAIHTTMFWTHAFLGLTLVASIPFTKLRHLVTAPLNILLRSPRKPGVLEKIDNIDETEVLGVGDITEFASQQLLSFDACVRCGRCEEACPATSSGMAYSPRLLMQTLRGAMVDKLVSGNGNSEKELVGEIVTDENIWSCTTCGACISKCPVFVNPVDEVIDLRRHQTLMTGKVPKSVADTMRNMERQGNPWGMPPEDRLAWAEGLGVRELAPGDETDVLLYLGCAFAYDDRNKKVAQSFVRLLQKAGVDFGILGLDEACCGETARRMGHEYLFQVFAEQNIEIFNEVKFNRIVTQCPHCFSTLKNEYPQMGGDYKVQHYVEYLAEISLPWEGLSPNGNGLKGQVSY
ncbi:heterodisulfide reductase-related iron-sulfur binding cluster, partial [Chloroflexota bacterium]